MAETKTVEALVPEVVKKTPEELIYEANRLPAYRSREDKEMDKLRAVEDRLLRDSMEIVSRELCAADIDDPDGAEQVIPDRWIVEHGLEEAAGRVLRQAKDGRKNRKNRPGYLDTARDVMVGILKARQAGAQMGGGVAIQVNVIVGTPEAYPVQDDET